jgi:hypothetical protein
MHYFSNRGELFVTDVAQRRVCSALVQTMVQTEASTHDHTNTHALNTVAT